MNAAALAKTQLLGSAPAISSPVRVKLPWLTLVAAVGAVAVAAVPGLAEALQYDRTLAVDEPWRLLTGHLTHWNVDHLLWDVLMFASLGWWIEAGGRRRLLALLLTSAAAITAYLWFVGPWITTYRGLSGIDSALFVYAAVMQARSARRDDDTLVAVGASAALIGFCGKVCFETLTGRTLFVDAAAALFTPLPTVHLVGAGVGLILALLCKSRK